MSDTKMIGKNSNKGKTSRRAGSAAVELACGSFVLIALTLVAIDVTVMMIGFSLNDRACRDACRSAAQQDTPTKAQNAASASLKQHPGDGYWVTTPLLKTSGADFVYQDFGGDPAAGNPTVTCTTECTVRFPVPVSFAGNSFGADAQGLRGTMVFRKRYTFPIVRFNLVLPP